MRYDDSLIRLTDNLQTSESMYSLICLSAAGLHLKLNSIHCFLDGKYLLCLSTDDDLQVLGGYFEALHLQFTPYFYNVNLNHHVIGMPLYDEMRAAHGYPDFHLFRHWDDTFLGILPLDEDAYRMVREHLRRSGVFIAGHETDNFWSCRTRSEMIAILRIAEGAGLPGEEGTDVIRYIQENIAADLSLAALCTRFHTNRTTLSRQIRERTGMTPMQYVREERLRQSLPDLLFTFLPIGEVAEKYGFADANYYIRQFRQKYGKTPQQYRTDGFDSRVQGEEFFHKREKDVLNRTAFEKYLNGGSGQAILMLRETEDKAPLRQIFLDTLERPEQILGLYEKELIDSFDDPDALAEEVVEMLLPLLETGERLNSMELLRLLGQEEKVREITDRLYAEAHTKLLSWMQSPEGKKKREKYPHCAARYMAVASAIGQWGGPEPERVRQILWDVADFFNDTDDPPVPCHANPLYRIMDGIGKEVLFSLLDEIAEKHPHGDKLHLKHELPTIVRPEPDPTITAEDILEMEEDRDRYALQYVSFAAGSAEMHRTVAEAILTSRAPERRAYLVRFFLPNIDLTTPPAFPLDPGLLVERVRKCRLRNRASTWEARQAAGEDLYSLLCTIRHETVRAYGEELLAAYPNDPVLYEYGLRMVFEANYRPEDRDRFAAVLYRKNREDRVCAFRIFCRLLQKGTPDLPMHLLPWLWDECRTAWMERRWLAENLLKHGSMPEKIREECRLDKFLPIRLLAEKG